jgi:NADPH-dependent 2,4-dienoyl-CoA reductase/sulfur reductase-like enzyme
MKKYDVVILGAGPAGIITGVTAKKQYPEKSMIMLRKEDKGLVPCGIPYIFHELNSVEKNVMGPKPFVDAGGEVVTDPAVEINPEEKTVKTESGELYQYDKLIFATGSQAVEPTFIPGYDLKNTFYIRKSYNYMTMMFEQMQEKNNIVVVGGGFIGAEVAEQLAKHGKKVTLVESEDQCFSKAFSGDLSKIATDELRNSGVDVKTSTLVEEVVGKDGAVSAVKLKDNGEIEADAVIFAIGYRPNVELAKQIGLRINSAGAIFVDHYGRTQIDDIYAVGDCAQTLGFMTGRTDNIMLASTATTEARILGYNLYSIVIKKACNGTIGIFSTEINGMSMAAAGLNEKNAEPANIEFIVGQFSDVDRHPGTLKDTKPLTLKLYVCPSDGSILGGEVWGGKSAGEIINTIGLAMQKKVTVYELISYQIGTHPLLTSAPTKPAFVKAAEMAIAKIRAGRKG